MLSVEPDTGSVMSGDTVQITCRVRGSRPVFTIFLYKEKSDQRRMINISGKSFEGVFEFRAKSSDAGTYYCVYDTKTFASVAYSNRVEITVNESIGLIAIGIRLAIFFILHLVVISVWCYKPGEKKHPQIHQGDVKPIELNHYQIE
ncbi:uncharacterized protein LOC144509037 isoform X2 [Mustelus asterias]